MSDICRLCLRKDDHIRKQNIFDLFLSGTIYWMFGVEVEAEDSFSKLLCQKCLDRINYVKKLQKFYQINQYLLKENKCPLDFDIEFFTLTFDVSTQTDFHNEKDITKTYNSTHISDSKSSHRKNMRTQNSSHVSIPKELFDNIFSPSVIVPKIDTAYSALGYEYVKPLVYKKVTKEKIPNEIEQECRHVGINTKLVQDGFHLTKSSDKIINSSFSNKSNYVSVPIEIFDSFASPYVQIERLESTSKFKTKQKTIFKSKNRKKSAYLNYYYRVPTTALKELINERNEEMTSTKKVVMGEKSLFKIDDVFHAEICEICHQVFKSKERLSIHRDIIHSRRAMGANENESKFSSLCHDHDYVKLISDDEIDKTKCDLRIWRKIKQALSDDCVRGTADLDKRYENVRIKLAHGTEIKEELTDIGSTLS